MSSLFEAIDPRGFKFVCTEECWFNHILVEHPEMADEEVRVKEAIQNPSLFIYQDKDYQERNIYYLPDSLKRYYIKVVVEFFDKKTGKVVTAFKTDSPRPGEKMIWPESHA